MCFGTPAIEEEKKIMDIRDDTIDPNVTIGNCLIACHFESLLVKLMINM